MTEVKDDIKRNCLLCDTILRPGNMSLEHIIPNALGGRLKSSNLICEKCNSECGDGCDAKLANDFNPFANLLGIKRDRGQPPAITGMMSGRQVYMNTKGEVELVKPDFQKETVGDSVKFKIAESSRPRLEAMLRRLAAKYPINAEEALKQAQTEHLGDYVTFDLQIGGRETFRAIVKMAYLFFKHKHPLNKIVGEDALVSFIRGGRDYKSAYFFFPRSEIVKRNHGDIYHVLAVKSFPKEKLLVAFIDLFSVMSFVITLSEDFTEDLEGYYLFDLVKQKELQSVDISFPLVTKKLLDDIFNKLVFPADSFKKRLASFLSLAQTQKQFDAILEKAIHSVFDRSPVGTTITAQMVNEFVNEIMIGLAPIRPMRPMV